MFKSGFVTIVGRPNVGKSTLLNYIMGEKLSIVSNKPQTTRNNIQTILTGDDYQMVFVDTPGIHKPKHKLGEYMVNSAKESTKDVDLVLFLTNPDEEIGKGDKFILETLKLMENFMQTRNLFTSLVIFWILRLDFIKNLPRFL